MWVTIGSVLIGFMFFGASFASFSLNKPRKLVWTLFAIAIVFMTVIPTTTAIFIATKG